MKKRILTLIAAILLIAASVTVTAVICRQKTEDLKDTHTTELTAAQAEADALRAQLQLAENERQKIKEILTDMIRRVDYKDETVYVIGHKTPDADTVCSAIGMAYLLNGLGIPAEARISGAPNPESTYVFSTLGYPLPEILENAAGKQLWLVDHSASTQMIDGAKEARIVGITDHHGIGDAETSEPICVLSCPAGSTCAVVYQLCESCGVALHGDVAGVLLAGLLSDTANMTSADVTKLDEAALTGLKTYSGITDTDALFAGMLDAKLAFMGMSDKAIFYSDYKDYERNGYRYGIGCVKIAQADLIPAMAERMQKIVEEEMKSGCEADFLLYSIYDTDYSTGYIGIVGKNAEDAAKLMTGAFGETAEVEGDYYIFRPSLSRKTGVVPPIDAYLDTLP